VEELVWRRKNNLIRNRRIINHLINLWENLKTKTKEFLQDKKWKTINQEINSLLILKDSKTIVSMKKKTKINYLKTIQKWKLKKSKIIWIWISMRKMKMTINLIVVLNKVSLLKSILGKERKNQKINIMIRKIKKTFQI